jgi:membrane fusion protein, multidrug efflux system
VKQFEQNLYALGYRGFTVDDEYTSSTATAVEKWQEKHGLAETGVVELGRVVYAAGEVRVATHKVDAGAPGQPGQAVLSTTGIARVVTVTLEVRDQRLAKQGGTVKVDLPDGKRSDGTITDVATVIETDDKDATTKIEVTIALANAVEGFTDAAVDVTFTADEREDVLTVPVAALLALAEGGYGIQIVEGDSTRIVAVQTGLFSGGRVEISGEGLSAGMTVGMPT